MKFTVEVDDFYLEEGELSTSLINEVSRNVISQIQESIKEKADKAITIAVKAKIEQELALQINLRVAELIASGVIIRDKKEVSIVDYIKDQFDRYNSWNSPYEQITRIAKEYGNEMKKRYDYFYANQIVQQMHTVGVLKEDVFANLIENKK